MSQVTEQSVRFQTALASIKLIQASAVLDLTEDDFDFLTSNKVWIATSMALLILALLQRIFLMSSLMLLLVWLIFFMVLIKLLPILGTISGKTVKLMVLALI